VAAVQFVQPCLPAPVEGWMGRRTCWADDGTQQAFVSLRQLYAALFDDNFVYTLMVVVFTIVSRRKL
jgi:hypothetical protein